MSEPRWYRSLYWRIALGLFAFLVLMVVAQAAIFVWMLEQAAGSMPARSPRRLAVLVASDVAAAMQADAALNLEQYVREQYAQVFQPFVVMMRDGRIVSSREEFPEELREAVIVESARQDISPREGRRGVRGAGRRDGRFGGPPVRGEPAWEVAPIIVDGKPMGRVVVLETPPLSRLVRELGPRMLGVALGVLSIGMTLIALFVFGPTRRRLKELEAATERLGTGDLTARAPEGGGDEVSSVARAFNRMADELAGRAAALEASERARRQLLADVSHDLMTPLTAMRGYVETLRMRDIPLDDATRDRYLGIIDDETHRLERLVGDLLELARVEGGGGALRRERVPVSALFDRVVARHERESQARGDRIVTHVGPGAEFVEGDPDKLEQALQNLAANALRHTPEGTEVVLSSSLEGGHIHLRVRDNGSGIPAEHLPLIFDRFYKADFSRHAIGGSGLGLSIVKAIVERHGGSITARNDGGAVFDIALPANTA
jgi:signal transduction histidine kinase